MAEEVKSKLSAILHMKCPRCRRGNMFLTSNPYNINKVHQMPEQCPECGQPYEPEPGFYIGAMYVNYGFTVILTGIALVVMEMILNVSAWTFFSIYVSALLLIGPFLFRYSRVIYLYLFVSYDKEAVRKHKLSE
ncbi:MAG TPA: DUF983 domain-containing protein [Cytophagaceae bacterium]|jgi:uncharacterized protein (DUF983 family)|nr:DUF983 domain-containing protein [Cytophagaceae bacterium]